MTDTPTPRLADLYAALQAERERDWPVEKLAANLAQRQALINAFDRAATVQVGDQVAAFELTGSDGATLTLEALTADGPVLLLFFRFAGCPACNIALPYYDRELRERLQRQGVRIVAVSPHLPEHGLDDIRTRHGLGFPIAADRDNALARRFGLTFLPIGNPAPPVADPNWIGALTGTGSWELPQPAAILIDADHVVRFVDVSPDWMARTEAASILQAVRPPARDRQLKLGFILHGVGRTWNDWRHPGRDTGASTSLAYYQHQAAIAEEAKFDFLFVADSLSITEKSSPHYLNRFEPFTILSALAATTSRIGLVATVTVSYSEPFNVARQFASLDHLSGGRAGWNVVTSWLGDTAANFSRTEHPPHDVRYRIAAEYLDVVQGLWDSWEDDAHVADKASGRFVDPDKLHRLDHQGQFFQVRGPLNIKRSPQGQPVIFQAGASDDGRAFAARRADVIFTHADTIEDGKAYYADVKARARGFGRDPDQLFILPGFAPIVADTDEEAEALYQELAGLESLETGFGFLSRTFNDHDFRRYDLDAPFPDVAHIGLNSQQSGALKILRWAQEDGLTLRQIVQRLATPRGAFVGSARHVTDTMEQWFTEQAADGFVLFEPLPGQLQAFADKVVPLLRARGLFREAYREDTFRGNLCLPFPENRYTVARARQQAA